MEELIHTTSGVDYNVLDRFKRMAQHAAQNTNGALTRCDFRVAEWSRGESCFLIETPWGYLAHVEEGLGTKNIVADAQKADEQSFYDAIAQDTVATIVNDMATVGARPISVAMLLAVGDESWFTKEERVNKLVDGWMRACIQARAVWGPGETPALRGNATETGVVLSGSAIGAIFEKEKVIRSENIMAGDTIVLLAGTGIHANGLTRARKVAISLPDGYRTPIPGTPLDYGEALLQATPIYNPIIEDCQEAGIPIHYAVHITGHGWRKLMRAKEPFVYVIEKLPDVQPIFRFIQQQTGMNVREMYATFNMGAGFALYVPPEYADAVIKIAAKHNVKAMAAGHIEKRGSEKQITGLLEFEGSDLNIR